MKKFLHWAPRILGILGIIFISLFALDAFQAGIPVSKMLTGFGMHLVPSILLLIFLLIAWKFALVGGIIFILVSLIPFFFLSNTFWVNGMLSISFLLAGVLFVLSSWSLYREQNKSLD
jgi:hypothetical protein